VIPLIAKITSLEAAMMGRRTGDQASLFYEFRLDDRIPKDHLLRRIDVAVGPILDGAIIVEIVDDNLGHFLQWP